GGRPWAVGRHEAWVSMKALGIGRRPRLEAHRGLGLGPLPPTLVLGSPGRTVRPLRLLPGGQLALDVGESVRPSPARGLAGRGIGPLRAAAERVAVPVGAVQRLGTLPMEVDVLVGWRALRARLEPELTRALGPSCVLSLPADAGLPAGSYPLSVAA